MILILSLIIFLVAAESASSPPRRQSKTGAVLCPSGTGKQEYGYIEVSQLRRLFYTSIQADGNPTTAPTFLFIRGGPGESSIGSALQVNGPCIMDLVTKRLIKNEFSWTRRVNGIWVDAPVPTGFSIGPVESGWENLIQDLIDFVNEFFKQHPNLNRDVHFVGTSASASMVVEVASRIIKSPSVSINNLVGLMIFSGVVGPQAVYRGCLQMAKDRQLLPQKTIDRIAAGLVKCEEEIAECNENGPGKAPIEGSCHQAVKICDRATINPLKYAKKSVYDIRVAPGKESTLFKLHAGKIDGFLNTKSVQDALGVSKVWKEISEEVFDVFGEYVAYDTTYQVTNLLDAGLKVLVVNGGQDYITNAGGAFEWISKLKGKQSYGAELQTVPVRDLKDKSGEVYGKLQASKYSNGAKLAFIKMPNAGHDIPSYQPLGFQSTFESFITAELWP